MTRASTDTPNIAVIGSPSTTTRVTLNLLRVAYGQAVYGHMVAFRIDLVDPDTGAERAELALGTVTSIETVNPAHSPRSTEAQHVAESGQLPALSGNAGDTRGVEVSIEAVFRRDPEADALAKTSRQWLPAGAALSNSPATGTAVTLLDQALVNELMVGVENQRFLGTLRGTNTLVPYTQRDFSGARGSTHSVVAGATGSGKTGQVYYSLACDLIYDNFGQIIFDPQGQFATETGAVFSLQGLAAATGRTVTVARLSRSLRLRKDAPMFTELLARVGVFTELAFGAGSDAQVANACRVMQDALDDTTALHAACGTGDWTEATPGDLLAYLLADLRDVLPTGTIYAGKDGQQRVRYAIAKPTEDELAEEGSNAALARSFRDGVLDQRPASGKRWVSVLTRFAAVHNLWSLYTPDGAARVAAGTPVGDLSNHELRRKAWPLLMDVFTCGTDQPAPWLILDLSADVDLPGLADDGDDEGATVADQTRQVLDDPGVKARIMRQLLGDLYRAGQSAFKKGGQLCVRTTVDEAWQFAAPVDHTTDKDIAALSDQFEDFARDARKLGIGCRFILQAPSGLREGIWKQCTERVIGYGISEQADLRRIANLIGEDHLRLYLATAGPEATGRYSFMLIGGGITGLSFGAKPVFLDVFDNPSDWLRHNAAWVGELRRRWAHRLPADDAGGPLTSIPPRPVRDSATEGHRDRLNLHAGASNRDAARALTSAADGTVRASFGWQPKVSQPAEKMSATASMFPDDPPF